MELSIKEMQTLSMAQEAYDKQEKRNFKLSLLLVKNSKILKSHLEDFEEARKKVFDTKESIEYKQKRQEIINSHRVVKENGEFETVEQDGREGFKIGKIAELNKKLQEFDKKYKDVIDKENENSKELEKRFLDKVDVSLQCITDEESIKSLDKEALILLAPIIKVKITEELLGDVASKLTINDIEVLQEYCTIE